MSSPNVTINEALSFLPKDVLLTGSLLFLTNKENFPQLWENFSNAVKRTSLIEWIEVSLKLLPEYNYLTITSASMASGKKTYFHPRVLTVLVFEISAGIQEFYFTPSSLLSEELAQLQISSISGNATLEFPKVLCTVVLPKFISQFENTSLLICSQDFQNQWKLQTWNSTLRKYVLMFGKYTIILKMTYQKTQNKTSKKLSNDTFFHGHLI